VLKWYGGGLADPRFDCDGGENRLVYGVTMMEIENLCCYWLICNSGNLIVDECCWLFLSVHIFLLNFCGLI